MSLWQESNLRPSPYKGVALPAELQRLVVVLVGNDPTTSSMSRKCSPIELQDNFELMEGVEPTYLRYKGNVMTIIRHQRYVEHLEGFEPPWLGLQSSTSRPTTPLGHRCLFVGIARLELATSSVSARYSNQLSYIPILRSVWVSNPLLACVPLWSLL